jgi:protein-S-isoprenylcysteine O-methyltransferase Ste14
MINKVAAFVAKHAGRERPTTIKILSLILGSFLFFILVPIALGLVGHAVAKYMPIHLPRIVEVSIGLAGISGGLAFLLWSVSTFWRVGRGTPVPMASPVKLVTVGPFKYTRNPIKLGAFLFYFGLGTVWDGLMTGLVMAAIAVILGTLYHKSVEEKELALRFGDEYEHYRKNTSFLIPLPPRKSKPSRQIR